MKKLAYEKDGQIRVVHPSERYREKCLAEGMSEADFLAHIAEKDCEGLETVEVEELPDRYFRAAWEIKGAGLAVDMVKAQAVHMDEIRKARNTKLNELDIETLKGVDVQGEKQALRDIPQTFDLTKAKTPEALKKLWPEGL